MAPRIIAAFGAIATGGAAMIGVILLMFLAAEAAEPGTATSRTAKLTGSLGFTGLVGALVASALVLGVYAATGRLTGWRRLAGLPLACALALGLVVGVAL